MSTHYRIRSIEYVNACKKWIKKHGQQIPEVEDRIKCNGKIVDIGLLIPKIKQGLFPKIKGIVERLFNITIDTVDEIRLINICKEWIKKEGYRLPLSSETIEYKNETIEIGKIIQRMKRGFYKTVRPKIENVFKIEVYKNTLSNEEYIMIFKEWKKVHDKPPNYEDTTTYDDKFVEIGKVYNDIKIGYKMDIIEEIEKIFNVKIEIFKHDDYVNACKKWVEINGDTKLPEYNDTMIFNNCIFDIGRFIYKLREACLSDLQTDISKLFKVNFRNKISKNKHPAEFYINACKEWVKQHNGDTTLPKYYDDMIYNGEIFRIGDFIRNFKYGFYTEIKPFIDDIFKKDISLSMHETTNVLTKKKSTTEYYINACNEWIRINGNTTLPKEGTEINYDGKVFKIGRFINNLKQGHNPEIKEQIEELFKTKIEKHRIKYTYDFYIDVCKKWIQINGTELPRHKDTIMINEEKFKIGEFISNLRYRKKSKLKPIIEGLFNQKINKLRIDTIVIHYTEDDYIHIFKLWIKENGKKIPTLKDIIAYKDKHVPIGKIFDKMKYDNIDLYKRIISMF